MAGSWLTSRTAKRASAFQGFVPNLPFSTPQHPNARLKEPNITDPLTTDHEFGAKSDLESEFAKFTRFAACCSEWRVALIHKASRCFGVDPHRSLSGSTALRGRQSVGVRARGSMDPPFPLCWSWQKLPALRSQSACLLPFRLSIQADQCVPSRPLRPSPSYAFLESACRIGGRGSAKRFHFSLLGSPQSPCSSIPLKPMHGIGLLMPTSLLFMLAC